MITNKYFKAMTFFFIFTMVALGGSSYAADITAKMQARLPAIKELKAKGVVGENNKGYLEFRGAPAKENVVQDENNDRKEVYATIAAKQGVTADVVGKRRAEQIADKAAPGEWLQNPSGNWYKKN
ncbi:MAG: YdbL family protein [Planctomycetes bacterium]|nr:YdbL family protein [Planctomycetota bacterium]